MQSRESFNTTFLLLFIMSCHQAEIMLENNALHLVRVGIEESLPHIYIFTGLCKSFRQVLNNAVK